MGYLLLSCYFLASYSFFWIVFPSTAALAGLNMKLIILVCFLSILHSSISPLLIVSTRSVSDGRHMHSLMYLTRTAFLLSISEKWLFFSETVVRKLVSSPLLSRLTQENLSCTHHMNFIYDPFSLKTLISFSTSQSIVTWYPSFTILSVNIRLAILSSAIQTFPFGSGICFTSSWRG